MSEVCDYSRDWIASWLGARPWPSKKHLLLSGETCEGRGAHSILGPQQNRRDVHSASGAHWPFS